MKNKRKLDKILSVVIIAMFVVIGICGCDTTFTMTVPPGDTSSWDDYPDISDLPDAEPTPSETIPWDNIISSLTDAAPQTSSTSPKTTTPAPTPTTTAPPTTTTVIPTTISMITTNPFRGEMSGVWSVHGKTASSTTYSGTFDITIDESGAVTGAFNGDNSGDVAGNVDLNGNLLGTGTGSGGTTSYTTIWDGQLVLSGNFLSIEGTLEGPYVSRTFSGTGSTSR
jgi:hypothetical protein